MRNCEKKYQNLDYEAIGRRIKSLRDNMQQSEFAKLFDICQQDISKIERAKLKPSPDLLLKISLRFGKSVEWLMTGQYDMKKPPDVKVCEDATTYHDPDPLIRKTAKILRSNTSFRRALDSNIEAFHEAVLLREDLDVAMVELSECRAELNSQKKIIEEMRIKISQLEAQKSAVKVV